MVAPAHRDWAHVVHRRRRWGFRHRRHSVRRTPRAARSGAASDWLGRLPSALRAQAPRSGGNGSWPTWARALVVPDGDGSWGRTDAASGTDAPLSFVLSGG